jgi:lambda repressor-like predicted transcriptional regulator
MKNKNTGMSPLEIRVALYEASLNQAAIARALGVTPSHISAIISQKRISRRVHTAIAEAIGRDKKTIWPDLYKIPGREPKRGRPSRDWKRVAA